MTIVDKFMDNINKSVRGNSVMVGHISNWILEKIKKEEYIESAKTLAYEIGVSNAMLSKYSKIIGYDNFSEVIFLVKCAINTDNNLSDKVTDKKIKKASNLITGSRKIFFVGVSNAYLTNMDFWHKLCRLDLWCVPGINKYEQIGQSKLLTKDDLIILNSVSMQHTWMKKLLEESPAKKIVITAADAKLDADVVFHYEAKEDSSFRRLSTIKNRLEVMKVYDAIFTEMLKDDKYKKLLIKSGYSHKK